MTQSITVDLWRLRRCIETVLPFTAGDDTRPLLDAVHLFTRRGHLAAEATGRYTMAIYQTPVDSKAEFDAVIRRVDCRQILAMFKPRRSAYDNTQVQLTAEKGVGTAPGWLQLESHGGELLTANEITCKWDQAFGDYPHLESVIRSTLSAPPEATCYAVRSDLLARFARVLPKHTPLRVRAGKPGKPIVITTPDDDFLGVIMPMNPRNDNGEVESGEPDYSAWPDYLPKPSETDPKAEVA